MLDPLFQTVPYSADIPGNFFPGRKLFLSGIVNKPFKQFTIDFLAGKDVAFRLNPRIKEKVWRRAPGKEMVFRNL